LETLIEVNENHEAASTCMNNSNDSIMVSQALQKLDVEPKVSMPSMKSGLLSRRRGFALAMDLPRMEMPPAEKQICPLSLHSDRYKILEKVGSGSAGMVHRAVHLESGREVALKIPRSGDPGLAETAKREYELLKSLEPHPNIIEVVDFHNLQGEAMLVLQFFDGLSLQAVVKTGRLPEPTARTLCTALFEAVAHLHAHNVLHRDIKPENVLVSNCQRHLCLIDFNVAACTDNGVPLTPTGTVLYKAPELLLGDIFCDRCDVWASGLCIFFMLSGSLPQGRDTFDELAIKKDVAVRPTMFCADCWEQISDDCQAMLQRCLATKCEARPTMVELLDDPWLSDPLIMRSLSLLSHVVPGAAAYLQAFSYLAGS